MNNYDLISKWYKANANKSTLQINCFPESIFKFINDMIWFNDVSCDYVMLNLPVYLFSLLLSHQDDGPTILPNILVYIVHVAYKEKDSASEG